MCYITSNAFTVNGIAYPNELLAILGSSGSGKTTLLNALTYRTTRNVIVSGIRCVNGSIVNSKSLTSVSGYVQQDDLFIPTLTIKEHLIFQVITFTFSLILKYSKGKSRKSNFILRKFYILVGCVSIIRKFGLKNVKIVI